MDFTLIYNFFLRFLPQTEARRPQGDSYNRLFGEPDRAAVPKLRAGSNIPIGNDAVDSSLKQSNGNVVVRETNGHEKRNYELFCKLFWYFSVISSTY